MDLLVKPVRQVDSKVGVMRLVVNSIFQHGSDSDKAVLSTLLTHADLVAGAHCVYVYSLVDSKIMYPNKAGSVIYIGEACRAKEPSGKRFTGHISKSLTEGNNYTTNHSLTVYYYAEHKLRLQVYRLDACKTEADRKSKERKLITAHVKLFGAQPIGQGTTGSNYTPKAISNLELISEEIASITYP